MVRLISELATDQRVYAAGLCLLVQIDAIGGQRILLLLLLAALFRGVAPGRTGLVVLGTARRACFAGAGALGDAVRYVVDRVVTGHLLFLQEIGGMTLALGEDCDEHVGAGHFLAPGRLYVDHRALDDALETCRGLGILVVTRDQIVELGIDIGENGLFQIVEIDVAGTHDGRGIAVVDQRQKQMFERRIFMVTLIGEIQRLMQRLF